MPLGLRRVVFGLAAAWALAAGCDEGPPALGCHADSDCPPAHRCVVAAAVCIGWSTPFDAAVPDLAPADQAPAPGDALSDAR